MKMRIKEKIKEIEQYLEELESIMPEDFKEYLEDYKSKAACERYFEKIIEAVIDLSFLIIKEKGLKIPEDDKKSFEILNEENIIPKKLTNKLKDAKGMRNIIAHDYGSVDDEIVFESITSELIKDVKEFLEEVNKIKCAE
ncbi:DUF86 domain-containing protein [Candidatus Woesearchaeota archaeon]|jgi:uncharacterized protein YutE (UPF0331/DUF86 family)|nr:DUF86 domain-containing protein [Candidatus Woesearchaeota archaeon]